MRISKKTDYAIQIMAAAKGFEQFTAAQMAQQLQIGRPTIAQCLKKLMRAHLLDSLRGVHGGYRLTRHPDTISIYDIMVAIEGQPCLTDCSHCHRQNDHSHPCRISEGMRQLNRRICDTLDKQTLSAMGQSATHCYSEER